MKIAEKKINNKITEITVSSLSGCEYAFINIGASLTKWITKDQVNIVASYLNYNDYFKPGMYLGTTIGLTSGRINQAAFVLDGLNYSLKESKIHFLHSGSNGISFKPFLWKIIKNEEKEAIIEFSLEHVSNVLPGKQEIKVTYIILDSEIKVMFEVSSDSTTLCNLTNHSYFNLDGDFDFGLKNHQLKLGCSKVVLVNEEFIGQEIKDVSKSPFDFRKKRSVYDAINKDELILTIAKGLDHFFLFDKEITSQIELSSSKSGKTLKMSTSYPGVTVYTTNYPSKKKIQNFLPLLFHGAIALEPHFQTNAINDSRFEGYILHKDESYSHFITYKLEETR